MILEQTPKAIITGLINKSNRNRAPVKCAGAISCVELVNSKELIVDISKTGVESVYSGDQFVDSGKKVPFMML